MGQLDNQPDKTINSREQGAAAESLKEFAKELDSLKENLIQQLSQEIEQLQAKKAQLLYETEQLELRRAQQLEQQQQLARQIAPAIANRLQELLRQQLDAPPSRGSGTFSAVPQPSEYNENAYRAIASLDSTLRTTFRTLQQDLSSYQSALSQQLGQMYSLEQQGSAILEALVERIRQELETKPVEPIPAPPIAPQPPPPTQPRPSRPSPPPQVGPIPTPPPPEPRPQPEPPKPAPKPKKVTAAQTKAGFILILIYSVALSLQNVVTRIIVKKEPSEIFGGMFNLGAYISASLGNSVLLLMLRMVVVVAVMAFLAGFLYPKTWDDVNQFARSKDWNLWLKVVGSGFFLFLSQVLIYIAFGELSPGVALTIFFIFPIVTVLLSWFLFGERPSPIRTLATVAVFLGVALIAFAGGGGGQLNISGAGLATAGGSGIAFALYVLLIQAGAKSIHPIPLSVINFATILIFSVLSLFLPFISSSVQFAPDMKEEIIVCGLVLGGLSLLSYLVNNIGISLIGAARAAIFGATGPAFTAILAWLIIGEGLNLQEFLGMLIVTVGVAAVSLERLLIKPKPSK